MTSSFVPARGPNVEIQRGELASGADATLIGRAYIYGLGAYGGPGVTRCLELIARELDLTMAFCGLRDVADIDARALWTPAVGVS